MPLDAITLKAILAELQSAAGTRIEKIQQPAKEQVILTLRGNRKLLLSAGAAPRIHFTTLTRENPAAPPMFCMLLRKHLSGGYIEAVEQAGLDRVAVLTIRAMDEIGVSSTKKLVLECISHRSNLILLDGEGRILDALRHVNEIDRADRQPSPQGAPPRIVLPGMFYHPPAMPEKADPLSVTAEELTVMLRSGDLERTVSQFLLNRFTALSPLVCREIAFQSFGSAEPTLGTLGEPGRESFFRVFFRWQEGVREGRFTPSLVLRDSRPTDFSYFPITQYGPTEAEVVRPSFSLLLDTFYEERERQDRVRQKGQDLLKTASTARDRVARKLSAQEADLERTRDRERLRICGELITANLYRMEKGASCLEAENYYEEGCPILSIPLDPLLTPQQNAAKYFKQYAKAKTAERVLTEQIEKGQLELQYLNSVLDELGRAELEQDFNDIRSELRAGGYLKGRGAGKKEAKRPAARPREFRSSAGLRILVGRSNTQNDLLVKGADKRDIWFHTQKIHGSHVILCTEGAPPDQKSVEQAAALAAYFSQGREGGTVAVDYTPVKNVKKPAGARPGMVVYDPYQTAYVHPDGALVRTLTVK